MYVTRPTGVDFGLQVDPTSIVLWCNRVQVKGRGFNPIADEMRESLLEKWYMASQLRIDALKLDAYISELGALVLEKGWEGKMCCKVLGAKMAVGQKFADWAYDI
jgi:hypothetical protein